MFPKPRVDDGPSTCPRCGGPLVEGGPHCDQCGFSLAGVHVYNPKSFMWLALLLSALVPIYLSASNWGRVGQPKLKRAWLGLSFLAYALIIFVFTQLPDTGIWGRSLGHLINLPVAFYLLQKQTPLYRSALNLGAQPASTFKGSLIGVGYLACALALALGAYLAKNRLEFSGAERLYDQGKYEEAAKWYEGKLRQDATDIEALLMLASSQIQLQRWGEASITLERYLKQDASSAVGYALLSHVREVQGMQQEADSLGAKARSLDPKIFEKLFEESRE